MGTLIFFLVMGTMLVVWPQVFSPISKQKHRERLQNLRSGGAENFFEERRSLETYRPESGPLVWRRVLGAMMIVVAVTLLVLPRLTDGG
ncbi:MAG: hypothetical protein DCF28_00845 [Alphaproteobacteria bacterium]|nr:MAG: hypothetical protein DCF28_00845 [Alphaproteobacteria bacterium]PZO39153.1 MAG: hypothetical protein DCE92_04745 [Alphaproteobacteria bacterium]